VIVPVYFLSYVILAYYILQDTYNTLIASICFPAFCLLTMVLSDWAFESFLSIRPLVLSIKGGTHISQRRKELVIQVRKIVNDFGPLVYHNFDKFRSLNPTDLN
jgi:hypothetical protein